MARNTESKIVISLIDFCKQLLRERILKKEYKRLLAQAERLPATTEGQAYQAFSEGDITFDQYTEIFMRCRAFRMRSVRHPGEKGYIS